MVRDSLQFFQKVATLDVDLTSSSFFDSVQFFQRSTDLYRFTIFKSLLRTALNEQRTVRQLIAYFSDSTSIS